MSAQLCLMAEYIHGGPDLYAGFYGDGSSLGACAAGRNDRIIARYHLRRCGDPQLHLYISLSELTDEIFFES